MAKTKLPAEGHHDMTPDELFGLSSSRALLAAWNETIDEIEASERAAAAEDGSICIR